MVLSKAIEKTGLEYAFLENMALAQHPENDDALYDRLVSQCWAIQDGVRYPITRWYLLSGLPDWHIIMAMGPPEDNHNRSPFQDHMWAIFHIVGVSRLTRRVFTIECKGCGPAYNLFFGTWVELSAVEHSTATLKIEEMMGVVA